MTRYPHLSSPLAKKSLSEWRSSPHLANLNGWLKSKILGLSRYALLCLYPDISVLNKGCWSKNTVDIIFSFDMLKNTNGGNLFVDYIEGNWYENIKEG